MLEKGYTVRSRRYFDQDIDKTESNKKKASLIVFEGAIDQKLSQQILTFFINKYKEEGHRVFTKSAPQMVPQLQQQLDNPLQFLTTMCRLTGEWYNEQIKPALDNGYLVFLDFYYHRYLSMAMVMEIQRAQQKMQKKLETMEQQGKPLPKEFPSLELDTRLISELRQNYTDSIPDPDVLFACFNDNDSEVLLFKKAFNELFSIEPYTYSANTFYCFENVIKEMCIRLDEYEIGGKV